MGRPIDPLSRRPRCDAPVPAPETMQMKRKSCLPQQEKIYEHCPCLPRELIRRIKQMNANGDVDHRSDNERVSWNRRRFDGTGRCKVMGCLGTWFRIARQTRHANYLVAPLIMFLKDIWFRRKSLFAVILYYSYCTSISKVTQLKTIYLYLKIDCYYFCNY